MTAMPESPVSVYVTTELSAVTDATFVFPVIVNATTESIKGVILWPAGRMRHKSKCGPAC